MGGKGSNCPPWLLIPSVFLWVAASLHSVISSDADVLLKFKDTMTAGNGNNNNAAMLRSWNPDTNPCNGKRANWDGVICTDEGKNVYGLQLENMSLSGTLDIDALAGLPELRTLSFQNNGLVGPIPNLGRFGALRSVFLSRNKFSGEIPDNAFTGMGSLRKVFLSQNGFSGPIPTSLAKVSKLVELRLEENDFTGGLPDLRQPGLKLNVSYNDLDGPIPDSLSKMDAASFIGNKDLCGKPLGATCQSSNNGAPGKEASSTKNKKLSTPLLVAIIVIAVVALLGLLGAVFALFRHRSGLEESQLGRPPSLMTKKVSSFEVDHLEKGLQSESGKGVAVNKEHDHGSLVFVREEYMGRFELQDLLRASAEVLGGGSFGSSYKAVLLSGASMVVKRFKEMNGVGREEFQEHMRRLGRLSHPNLLPLVAYYYRKEEKLLVTDYISNGSLAHLLHGNRGGSNHPKLNWPIRLKIVKGVARGLAYLQNELPMLTLFHGHLKSSNVLLSDTFEPLLTDHALVTVMNPSHATQVMVAYKSPEYVQFSRTMKKTDVWSLGMLILEVLSGQYPPASFIQQGQRGTDDLASWANSVAREEWTGEAFNGEMLKLLQVGLGCCEEDVGKRWELMEAVEKIEELRGSDEGYSSYVSEGDVYYSSRVMPDDEGALFLHK